MGPLSTHFPPVPASLNARRRSLQWQHLLIKNIAYYISPTGPIASPLPHWSATYANVSNTPPPLPHLARPNYAPPQNTHGGGGGTVVHLPLHTLPYTCVIYSESIWKRFAVRTNPVNKKPIHAIYSKLHIPHWSRSQSTPSVERDICECNNDSPPFSQHVIPDYVPPQNTHGGGRGAVMHVPLHTLLYTCAIYSENI